MLNPGDADTLELYFNTGSLDSGLYEAELVISSNDIDESSIVIPVSLEVLLAPEYICGDANGDGNGPNVADLVFMVDFLFKGGPAPTIIESANADGIVNGDIYVNVADLTYMVDYIFKGGDPPICEL